MRFTVRRGVSFLRILCEKIFDTFEELEDFLWETYMIDKD